MPGAALLLLLRAYQKGVSPLKPPCCRFAPSCSHYAYTVIARHGAWRGLLLTLRRLLRCHPWHPGGVDPPPPRGPANDSPKPA
ncbi:MAG: membrane protein insertion efficiency factor YidD [Myxococcota bacterium]